MPKFFRNLLLLSFSSFLFFCLLATPAKAKDQRCWTEKTCSQEGTFFGPNSETFSVCGMKEDASKQKIGFCLPAGQATTQVNFAGKSTFLNFGEFIKWIYNYGVIVAGGLAVIIVISAGVQWSVSAGSPEKITAAKKKIGGAMMGLFIAVASYFILNTINPYLINLRLPQVWKINTVGLVPPYCDEVEGKKLSLNSAGPFETEPKDGECGKEYYVEGGSEDVKCKGTGCGGRDVCLPFGVDSSGKKTAPICDNNYLTIHYSLDSSVQNYFKEGDSAVSYILSTAEALFNKTFADIGSVNEPDWLDPNDNQMIILCVNKSFVYVDDILKIDKVYTRRVISKDAGGKPLDYYEYLISYDFSTIQKVNKGSYSCNKGGDPVGFFVKHDLDMEIDTTEWNMYVYPLEKSKRSARIARFGGEETGMWPFSFLSFKDKNYFFEVNFNGSMIKNLANQPLSSPEKGSLASQNSYWEHFTWKVWSEFWGDVLF